MKALFGIVLLVASIICDPALAKQTSTAPPNIKIINISMAGTISVTIRNSSVSATRLWDDGNSWGAARWRVLVVRNGQLDVFYQNPNQRFTKNAPLFNEIAEGKQFEQRLDLNAGNWCRLDYCASFDEQGINGKSVGFEPNDMIFVVYDVPRTDEAIKMQVWYGVVAAKKSYQ